MKKFLLSGEVGWEITAQVVSDMLTEAGGEDIEVMLSSPGGNFFEGLNIYSLIENYAGSKTVVLGGFVASAATVIAMAFDKVIAQDVSVFMIHNAKGGDYGDSKTLQKTAESIAEASAHMASLYATKTKKSKEDIQALMDDETYFYGSEILDAGFADELRKSGKTATAKSLAIASCKKEYQKFVAMAGQPRHEPKAPQAANKPEGEKIVTKEELLKELKAKVAAGEITQAEATAVFANAGLVLTAEQTAELKALGVDDPVAAIKKMKETAAKAEVDRELDAMFGTLKNEDGTDNPLRIYAAQRADAGMKPEDIKADPVAIQLSGLRAQGNPTIGKVEPEPAGNPSVKANANEPEMAGGAKIAKY